MTRDHLNSRAILDFTDGQDEPRRLCFTNPLDVITTDRLKDVRPSLRAVEEASSRGLYAVGYVAYEAAPAFDSALVVRREGARPLLWFGIFDAPDEKFSSENLSSSETAGFSLSEWEPSVSREAYARNVEAAREAIARGDTYQVNYTMRLRARFEGDDWAFHRRLLSAQRARYGAYLRVGNRRILSASPELFFHKSGRRIVARPMKGTVRRGLWCEEDERLGAWLAGSEKNRAENVMIVDLLRNDLGRIADIGTVKVESLYDIERYPTVFQMTSTVAARLRAGVGMEEIFAALYPCGSVTGAPKVSTMRLIASLEDSPRDAYCGAIGYVAPGGDATFNVAIRTVVIDCESGTAEYGVGGGVTWDSTAEGEYAEASDKARLLTRETPRFELLETMRLENSRFHLLDEHLNRLGASASYFDIPASVERARAKLYEHARLHPRETRRVRLLVSLEGEPRVESGPLELTSGVRAVALALAPVSRDERFLYHKTTRREVYSSRRAVRPDAFDVLLWNEEGELTEFTTGNLVVELDGRLWTPPVECGLLAGVMRAELVARGEVAERVLTRADLERAFRCWLVNSVRGWVEVAFTENAGESSRSGPPVSG